jgi:hypothetical protein
MMDHQGEVIATLKEGGSFNTRPQQLKLTQW